MVQKSRLHTICLLSRAIYSAGNCAFGGETPSSTDLHARVHRRPVIYRRLADSLRALLCLSFVDAAERNTLRPQINRHNARFSEKEEEVQL